MSGYEGTAGSCKGESVTMRRRQRCNKSSFSAVLTKTSSHASRGKELCQSSCCWCLCRGFAQLCSSCHFHVPPDQVCLACQSCCRVSAGGTLKSSVRKTGMPLLAQVPPKWTHAKAAAEIALAFNPEHVRASCFCNTAACCVAVVSCESTQ